MLSLAFDKEEEENAMIHLFFMKEGSMINYKNGMIFALGLISSDTFGMGINERIEALEARIRSHEAQCAADVYKVKQAKRDADSVLERFKKALVNCDSIKKQSNDQDEKIRGLIESIEYLASQIDFIVNDLGKIQKGLDYIKENQSKVGG